MSFSVNSSEAGSMTCNLGALVTLLRKSIWSISLDSGTTAAAMVAAKLRRIGKTLTSTATVIELAAAGAVPDNNFQKDSCKKAIQVLRAKIASARFYVYRFRRQTARRMW